jgi:hypothetical protein
MNIPTQLQRPEFRFILVNGKHPQEELWTTKNNYQFSDPKLIRHISQNKNYGVCGGYGDLLIIDFDNEELQNIALSILPKTFSVKSGGKGLLHLYYKSNIPNPSSYDIFQWERTEDGKILTKQDKNNKTVPVRTKWADIQGVGHMVVGVWSIHPISFKRYEISDGCGISEINYDWLKNILMKYCDDRNEWTKQNRIETPRSEERGKQYSNADCGIKKNDIKNNVRMSDIDSKYIKGTSHKCPFCCNNDKSFFITVQGYKCYHASCDKHGDVIQFLIDRDGLTFQEALSKIAKEYL